MARRFHEEPKGGLPGWMGTYGDLVTLLLCFFVLLFSMSSIDITKYKAAISSFADQIDIMPGGVALTGEELIMNGISQLSEIEIILENKNPTTESSQDPTTDPSDEPVDPNQKPIDPNQESVDPDQEVVQGNFNSKTKEIAEQIEEYLKENNIETRVAVSYNANYVKLALDGEALFDSGKAIIKDEYFEVIEMIIQVILDNDYDQYQLQIEGHTDNVPMNSVQFPSNWYLSAARAIAVGTVFINEYGFSPDRVACTGYGEFKPVADNDTAEGRALNRRVEIKIIVENEEIPADDSLLIND